MLTTARYDVQQTGVFFAALRGFRHSVRSRIVNLDPGYFTAAALIMATAKDFSHRVPLRDGIYAHLEFLYSKNGIRRLDWTYPDFANPGYEAYFLEVRRAYLRQLKDIS